MEEQEHEEQKPIENWNGEERRQGGQGNYEGDERRKASAMPTGDLTGGDAGMSEADEEKADKG
jgi:hypothetical protein